MAETKKIIVDEHNKLFDKKGMFHKKFVSDFRQIRYFTLLVVQKAPPEIKELNLLEQQISEIIKNAVKHGNHNNPKKHIDVWYSFSETYARLIVKDRGDGFKDIEKWNEFNQKRNECFQNQNFEEMSKYVSFITDASDENDSGNALFAALEYWDGGIVFNNKRNTVALAKHFPKKRHGIKIGD